MFRLDPRLENSSFKIIDLSLCEVRLKDNQYFPWCLLIPKVNDVTEIFELTELQRKMLMDEMTTVSRVMNAHFSPVKMNVGALGNMVPQLHIHVIARYENDPCWPQSIWQPSAPEKSYSLDQKDQLLSKLRALLS